MTLRLAFYNGGPAALVYGTLLAGFGHAMVALSLGEMASMDPTVGAQYRWSARFARKHQEFFGLIQGWITTFGWMVGGAGILSILAANLQGMILFLDPTYEEKPYHTTFLMWALMLLALIFNLFLRSILNAFETIGGIFHVLFYIAVITILATLGERNSAEYVFTTVTTGVSGWNDPGVCWSIGLLSALAPLSGFDSVLHMVDETRKPRERVPKAMVWTVIGNASMQFGYVLTLLFCMGDPTSIATAPNPLIQIFYNATKSKSAAIIIFLMHIFIQTVALFNIIASASRLGWAFARDKGLPFHELFSSVHPRLQIPTGSLLLNTGVVVVLSLVNIGSEVALSALLTITAVAIASSYFLPICLLLIRKLKNEHPRYGPFKLGRWGIPINLFSLSFLLYIIFWTAFPIIYPVTIETFNFAGPIFIAVLSLALLDWFTTGKKRFTVPVGEYNIEMEGDEHSGKASSQ